MIRTTFRALALTTAIALAPIAATLAVPAPAHAKMPADKLGELPYVYDAAISPDGSKIAIYGHLGAGQGVQVIDMDNLSAKPSGFVLPSEVKPGKIVWANNEQILSEAWVTRDAGSVLYDGSSLFTFNTKSQKGDWLVTKGDTARLGSRMGSNDFYEFNYSDIVDLLPNDPDHILMSYAVKDTGIRPVHKVNVATGADETIEYATRETRSWATDTTGALRVTTGLKKDAKTEADLSIKIRDLDGEWKEEYHWPGIDHETRFYGFTTNPAEMVIGHRNGRDTRGLYVYDLGRKSITRKLYHNDIYDVSGVVRDKRTQEVIGANYVGDTRQTVMLDGNQHVLDELASLYPDYHISVVDLAEDGQSVLFKATLPYDPGVLLYKRKGEAKPVKVADIRPGVDPTELGIVIPVRYTARDGQKIPAYVTLPPTVNDTAGIADLPFIVLPHGGPYARDVQAFDWFAQFFASRGYGVLQMNFRGSTGYGEQFKQAGRRNWKVMRDDVTDGAKWLLEKGYADPERMCVAGWSFGGYAALMNGVDHPEMFSCVVAVAALSDLESHVDEMRNYRNRRVWQKFIKDGFRDRADMKANSPINVVSAMKLPTFIAHAEHDLNVDYGQHRRLRSNLKSSEAKLTTVEFDDDDHSIWVRENRQELLREIAEFLEDANGKSEYMKD